MHVYWPFLKHPVHVKADNDEGVGSEDDMGDYLSNLEIDEDQEDDSADEDDDDVIGPDSQAYYSLKLPSNYKTVCPIILARSAVVAYIL